MDNIIIKSLIFAFFLFTSVSCTGRIVHVETKNNKEQDTNNFALENSIERKIRVGQKIVGNFNANSPDGNAYIIQTIEGEGNPIDDDNAIADEYAVYFSDKSIAALPIGCCDATLIYEGDLDGDGADELSIYQAPMNGCTYRWTTYTYKNGAWAELFDSFLLGTGCDQLFETEEQMQDMVSLESDGVYCNQQEPSESDWIRVKVPLK